MGRARRAVCQVLYNGIEVGLSGRLKSLSYTDNACGVSGREAETAFVITAGILPWMI